MPPLLISTEGQFIKNILAVYDGTARNTGSGLFTGTLHLNAFVGQSLLDNVQTPLSLSAASAIPVSIASLINDEGIPNTRYGNIQVETQLVGGGIESSVQSSGVVGASVANVQQPSDTLVIISEGGVLPPPLPDESLQPFDWRGLVEGVNFTLGFFSPPVPTFTPSPYIGYAPIHHARQTSLAGFESNQWMAKLNVRLFGELRNLSSMRVAVIWKNERKGITLETSVATIPPPSQSGFDFWTWFETYFVLHQTVFSPSQHSSGDLYSVFVDLASGGGSGQQRLYFTIT